MARPIGINVNSVKPARLKDRNPAAARVSRLTRRGRRPGAGRPVRPARDRDSSTPVLLAISAPYPPLPGRIELRSPGDTPWPEPEAAATSWAYFWALI